VSDFEKAILVILKREGGYVWNPNDAGGETNFGLSKRTYPLIDIKNMTVELAKLIYYRDWWKVYQYNMILDQSVATKTFDLAVNMGARTAHRILQHAANALGGLITSFDGELGPETTKAVNSRDNHLLLLQTMRDLAQSHYEAIIAVHPEDEVFRKGWINRAQDRDGLIT
jgi:lysozyme family protein